MKDQAQCLAEVHAILQSSLNDQATPKILEAGGGSFSHIRLDRDAHISVLDISPEQLARNDYADERILGDLEDPRAIQGHYDLIVCFDVLEHLRRPHLALSHMVKGLADGGLLVIGCPNRSSTKGLITRYTPHGFHIWYYKTIRGIAEAGQKGHAPFETFLDARMDFDAVMRHLLHAGLEVLLAQRYEGPAAQELKAKFPLLYRLYATPASIAELSGTDRERLAATDWMIVARRPAAHLTTAEPTALRA